MYYVNYYEKYSSNLQDAMVRKVTKEESASVHCPAKKDKKESAVSLA